MSSNFKYQPISTEEEEIEDLKTMDRDTKTLSSTLDLASSPTLSPSSSAHTNSPFLTLNEFNSEPHPNKTSSSSSSSSSSIISNSDLPPSEASPDPSSQLASSEALKISVSQKGLENPPPSTSLHFSPPPSSSSSLQRRFIRFYGIPTTEGDASAVDTVVLHATNLAAPKPILPDLSPTTAFNYLVDVIDAENEDPFTLEPFENLMKACAEQQKDFILARVTTVDPSDESKFYYSYYAAHHINKVLFRTQPEEGLLHRMKAKNPLNNMTIIGDVHYYSITPEAFREARHDISEKDIDSPLSPSPLRRSKLIKKSSKPKTLTDKVLSSLSRINRHKQQKLLLVMTNSGMDAKPQDDEPMDRSRRPSADDVFYYVAKSSKTENRGSVLDLPSFYTDPKTKTYKDPLRSITLLSPRPRSLSDKENVKPSFPSGPLSPQLLSAEEKIEPRSVSFQNEKRISQLRSMTVEDWVRFHCNGFDSPILSPLSPSSTDVKLGEKDISPNLRRRLSKSGAVESPSSVKYPPLFYEFRFHSTDDDFLMKSSVRMYFKKNALDPTDTLLFSIPTSTTVILSDDNELEPHPALSGFRFAIDDEQNASFFPRIFSGKGFIRTALLLYIVVGSLLIRFVVPDNLVYLFSFLLIFLLCMAFIFMTESGSN